VRRCARRPGRRTLAGSQSRRRGPRACSVRRRTCGEEVGDEGLGDEAAAEAVEREQSAQPSDDASRAVERGAWLGCELVASLDRRGQVVDGDEPGSRGDRVKQQPLWGGADKGDQGACRACESGDRVVGAEEACRVPSLGGVWEHRLLERRERSRFDDVRRERPGQRGGDQRRQPAGDSEDGAGARHQDEQDSVGAASPEAVAVTREQHRSERVAGEERREEGAHGRVRVPPPRQRDPDQHRPEPVREGARCLRGHDAAGIRAQTCSSKTFAPQLSGQRT
jgi:hypothetical protein